MKIFPTLAFAVLLVQGATAAIADSPTGPSAQEIVTQSDKVRNPEQSFRTTTTLTEYVSGQERDHDTLIVLSKRDAVTQQYRNLVQYVDPPRDAGKRVLLDGRSLWFYDPSSKTSVRISPQQRLIGQAAIGDVLTINLAIDYKAALAGSETIQDSTRQERQCWHLDLAAATDRAVYHYVEYWVEKGTYYPIKGKLYSDSGRVLKIIYFRDFAQSLGAVRPNQAVIIDAVDTSLATVASLKDRRLQEVPDAWFGRDYLPRLDSQ
jgi:outer membrane lipoprotein-sorting protein